MFVVVLLLCLLLAFANLGRLFYPFTLNLFWLGEYRVPALFAALLAVVGVAAVYALTAALAATGAKARSADYLRRIDDLQQTLGREEASRFAALQASLDGHAKAILSRLDGAGTTGHSGLDRAISSFNARVDRVRDELAADIASAEDAILRAQGAGVRSGQDPTRGG
jgi:hypothetical protein